MKKIPLAIIAAVVLCTTAFGGNVDPGRIEIGGSAGLAMSTARNSGTFFYLNPFAMYYLAPGLALGGSLGFSSYGNSGHSSSSLSIGPRVAYYFDIGNPTFYPFVAGGFYWSSDNDNIGIPVEGGIRFFLNDFVALDAGLNLNFHDNTTDITLGAGLSMFLR